MLTPKFLLINKPAGPTSHDIVDYLRKITGIKKIGHAGTLDPFASGLLLVAVGRESTKEISKFVGLDKEYLATLKLGAVSDTYDRTGNVKKLKSARWQGNCKNIKIQKQEIERVLKKFIGEQEQIPPMFSAKKVGGKKLYDLARKGIEIKRKPQKIVIYNIKLKNLDQVGGRLSLIVSCSSGTYIRTLAHDIGQALGCGAYLEELVRTKIGDFKLEDALEIGRLTRDNWREFCINVDRWLN